MADESEVKIKITGDASGFKKSVEEATSAANTLKSLTKKFRESGMKEHKALAKITKRADKSQSMRGKEALDLEKKLQKEIRATIKDMKAKQKAFKNNTDAIKDEIAQVKKLQAAYKETRAHRQRTGVRSLGERLGGVGRGMGAAAGGAGSLAFGVLGGAGALVASLGAMLVRAVASQFQQGYGAYVSHGRARAGLAGMGSIRGRLGLGGQATGVFDAAQQYGFSATETVQQMRGVGRATGNINAVTQAQRFARSYGGDVGEVTGLMGVLTRAGQGFGGKMGTNGRKQLEKVMAQAFSSGLDRSRAGEYMSAVGQAVASAQATTTRRVDAGSIGGILSLFSRSMMPGLQGAAGFQNLSAIDSAVKGVGFGGGDEATKAMMYQAMGFGSPGGSTSYYEATRGLQRGVFGEGGAANLMNIFERFGQAGGGMGGEEATLMLSRTTGLSLDALEDIQKVMMDSGSTSEERLEAIKKITEEQRPVDQKNLAVNSEHLKVAQRVAYLDNRLVGIGEASAESIEKIQDVVNDVVDTLMPVAVELLKFIADTIKMIWDWLRNFMVEFREATGVNKDLNKIEKERMEYENQFAQGQITEAQLQQKLNELAGRAGSHYTQLQADNNPFAKTWMGLQHLGVRVGRDVFGADLGQSALEEHEGVTRSTQRMRQRLQRRAIAVGAGAGSMSESEIQLSDQIALKSAELAHLRGPTGPRAGHEEEYRELRSELSRLRSELSEARTARLASQQTEGTFNPETTRTAAHNASTSSTTRVSGDGTGD